MRALAALLAALALAPMLAAPAEPGLAWSQDATPLAAAVQHVGGTAQVLVAGTADGAWRSLDGGEAWEHIAGFPAVAKGRVAVDPTEAGVLYVAGFGGVARSLDGGATWTKVLAVARAARIDVSLTGKLAVGARYADASNHLLVSSDRGATWTDLPGPLPADAPICGLAFAPFDDWLLVMTDTRSWFSRDGGQAWTETPGAGFEVAIEESGIVWRGVTTGAVERTADGGATWQAFALPGGATALGPRAGGGVAVATTAGLMLTRDGAAWEDRGWAPAMGAAHGLAPDPRDPEAVFVTDPRRGLARVAPGAAGGWSYRGLPLGEPAALDALGADPHSPLVLASGPLGAYASPDGGASWAHTGAGIAVLPRALAAAAGRVYVGGRDLAGQPAIEVGAVGGTFTASALPGPGAVTGLVADGADGARAWAAVRLDTGGGRVVATGDGGATWSTVLEVPFAVFDVAGSGGGPGELLVGTERGVLARVAGLWVPVGVAPNATTVAAGPSGRFAASGLGASVWRADAVTPLLLPWADAGPVADLAAAVGGVLATTVAGRLLLCTAEGCTDATPPDGTVRAALETAVAGFAATDRGLWLEAS